MNVRVASRMMKRRLFKHEVAVFLALFPLGILISPTVMWLLFARPRDRFEDMLSDFYVAVVRRDPFWWIIPILICVPAIAFEVFCSAIWAWKNRTYVKTIFARRRN